jgi:hypothetical protein
MSRLRIIGAVYLAVAALNIYHAGFVSPNWIPWALLAAGALTWEPAPAAQKGQKMVLSDRKKASLTATILGVTTLAGLVIYRWRR